MGGIAKLTSSHSRAPGGAPMVQFLAIGQCQSKILKKYWKNLEN